MMTTPQNQDSSLLPLCDIKLINKKWLQQILSNYYDCHCNLLSYKIDSPPKNKEGFLSEIAYVTVFLSLDEVERKDYLVVKCLPNLDEEKEFVINAKLGEREVEFYKFSKSKEFKKVTSNSGLSLIIPEVLYSDFKDESITVVMKNLKTLNYKTIITREGSSLEQTLLTLSAAAVIHAAGLCYFKTHGSFSVKEHRDTSFYEKLLVSNMEKLFEVFNKDPLLPTFKQLVPYMEKMRNNQLQDCSFKTVIHGDLWAAQCMFSEDEKQICILDWQFSNLGSPAIDLISMLIVSSDPIILEENLSEILEHYWGELEKNLKKNNIDFHLSFSDFLQDVEKLWITGFMYLTVSLIYFLEEDNISHKRLKDVMNFLHRKNVFKKFIQQCQE